MTAAADDEPAICQEPHSGTRSRAKIVIGVVSLGLFLCCGGGALLVRNVVVNDIPAATAAVDEFFDLLQSGEESDAYNRTALMFKSATSYEEFRELIATAPSMTNHISRTIELRRIQKNIGSSYVVFLAILQAADRKHGCTVTMRKEEGEWKVAGLTLDASMIQTTPKEGSQ